MPLRTNEQFEENKNLLTYTIGAKICKWPTSIQRTSGVFFFLEERKSEEESSEAIYTKKED